ncbi:MAG: TIGR03960 family B12-binding radical SAM protein [Desulfobacterales bacterium]
MEARSDLRGTGADKSGIRNPPCTSLTSSGLWSVYELNYTNILTILGSCGLPFRSWSAVNPIPIIAGGPCTCNPEPVADFFDAMVIGDGESVIAEMAEVWLKWKESGKKNREDLLRQWSRIQGVYIPSFFVPGYDENGFQTLSPRFPDYASAKRAAVPDLDKAPFPDAPVVPFGRPVHDRLRLEVARGCTRGCRFCQAGMIYRPVRERSPETLLSLSESALASTGYEDISLLSLSTGDYSCIDFLMSRLMDRCEASHTAISLPSLRAGTLSPELMEQIRKVRKTGFTIAPEAGSQRMRDAINKNITHQDIFDTVRDAFAAGWQVIKLYFMIGMPTETQEDVEAIAELVRDLRKIKGAGRKGKINVSVGTFIPKPHTPFQWFPQISVEEAREKIFRLRDELMKMPGVGFKWQKPEISFLEGLWARGDRRLSALLVNAHEKGCRLDGWSDHFRFDLWQQAIAECGTDAEFFTRRVRDAEEPLPWDHIDTGVTKEFLKTEWEKALTGESTGDCRTGVCNLCGVCDFDTLAPRICDKIPAEKIQKPEAGSRKPEAGSLPLTFQLFYEKRDKARFFGHLEMVSLFVRALRSAGIPLAYSQGFHPMPSLSFGNPLPVGMESLSECFFMKVTGPVRPAEVPALLNARLPEGLRVLNCRIAPAKSARAKAESATYRLRLRDEIFDEKGFACFSRAEKIPVSRTNKKGMTKTLDLKEGLLRLERISPDEIEMELRTEPGKMIRPADAVSALFGISEESLAQARVTKM